MVIFLKLLYKRCTVVWDRTKKNRDQDEHKGKIIWMFVQDKLLLKLVMILGTTEGSWFLENESCGNPTIFKAHVFFFKYIKHSFLSHDNYVFYLFTPNSCVKFILLFYTKWKQFQYYLIED